MAGLAKDTSSLPSASCSVPSSWRNALQHTAGCRRPRKNGDVADWPRRLHQTCLGCSEYPRGKTHLILAALSPPPIKSLIPAEGPTSVYAHSQRNSYTYSLAPSLSVSNQMTHCMASNLGSQLRHKNARGRDLISETPNISDAGSHCSTGDDSVNA